MTLKGPWYKRRISSIAIYHTKKEMSQWISCAIASSVGLVRMPFPPKLWFCEFYPRVYLFDCWFFSVCDFSLFNQRLEYSVYFPAEFKWVLSSCFFPVCDPCLYPHPDDRCLPGHQYRHAWSRA